MRKKVGILKRMSCLLLIFLLSINSFAAIVSDNDGSAFITKAEFDALKSSFQAQIDSYNQSIDAKIDGAIASYLAGISLNSTVSLTPLIDNCNIFDNVTTHDLPWAKNKAIYTIDEKLKTSYTVDLYGVCFYNNTTNNSAWEYNCIGAWTKYISNPSINYYIYYKENGKKTLNDDGLNVALTIQMWSQSQTYNVSWEPYWARMWDQTYSSPTCQMTRFNVGETVWFGQGKVGNSIRHLLNITLSYEEKKIPTVDINKGYFLCPARCVSTESNHVLEYNKSLMFYTPSGLDTNIGGDAGVMAELKDVTSDDYLGKTGGKITYKLANGTKTNRTNVKIPLDWLVNHTSSTSKTAIKVTEYDFEGSAYDLRYGLVMAKTNADLVNLKIDYVSDCDGTIYFYSSATPKIWGGFSDWASAKTGVKVIPVTQSTTGSTVTYTGAIDKGYIMYWFEPADKGKINITSINGEKQN